MTKKKCLHACYDRSNDIILVGFYRKRWCFLNDYRPTVKLDLLLQLFSSAVQGLQSNNKEQRHEKCKLTLVFKELRFHHVMDAVHFLRSQTLLWNFLDEFPCIVTKSNKIALMCCNLAPIVYLKLKHISQGIKISPSIKPN